MTLVQIILLLFLWFSLSRVILQFRLRQISPLLFLFWFLLFVSAMVVVILPTETTRIARLVGIGRGVDLATYASIVVLFYLVFRVYIAVEDLKHEITKLVRQLALQNLKT
jgi:hypothetical protein